MRRFVTAFWLALALLLGQQAAALHALGHATERLHQSDSTPASSTCDQCFACAELSGAIGVSPPTIPAALAGDSRPFAFSEQGVPATVRLAFRSRAPPALLA